MDNRLSNILKQLNQVDEALGIKTLAAEIGVSERTIYTDIEKLNKTLRALNYPLILNSNGKLLFSEKLPVSIDELKNSLISQSYTDSYQRQLEMMTFIILNKIHFTAEELSSMFYVSRSTVLKDISLLREWIKPYDIEIISIPFKGYRIKGEELTIRAMMVNHLSDNTKLQENNPLDKEDRLVKSFEEYLIKRTDDLDVEISDESFDRLLTTLFVVYHRIKLGFEINAKVFPHVFLKEELQFIESKNELESVFKLTIPDEECRYLAMKFSESSVVENDQFLNEEWITLTLLTKQFIEAVAYAYGFDGFNVDETLFKGIINHLRPAYKRARANEPVSNPLYDYVVESHCNLHKIISSKIRNIEESLHVCFTSHETSFFTLLFASSYERNNVRFASKPRVMIICHAGLSTSEILRSKIVTNFYVEVVGSFGVRRAHEWLENHTVDLIISTVEFEHESIPTISVNPYLSSQDKLLVQNELQQIPAPMDVDRLITIITKHADIYDVKKLKAELYDHYGLTHKENEYKGGYQPMLLEVLKESCISVNAECSNRNEAVIESGKLLVDANYAEERYVQAMIDNVEENGTYIVIAPGIAMPHARPEEGAKDIGLSIVTLAEPVVFGHPKNDPVRIVVGLCAVDHQTHLKALSELVDILGDSSKVEQINKAETPKEIIKIIKGGE